MPLPATGKKLLIPLLAFIFVSPIMHAQNKRPLTNPSKTAVVKGNSPSNSVKKYIITDSIFHDEWELVGEPLNTYPVKKLFVDSAGNFFGVWLHRRFDFDARPLRWEDSLIINKLEGGKWISWHLGLPSQTESNVKFELSTDERLQYFISCNTGLYKLSSTGWSQVFKGCCQDIPKIMSDGNLYTVKTDKKALLNGDTSAIFSIGRFDVGSPAPLVTYTLVKQSQKPYDIVFDIGKDGALYCFQSGDVRESSTVYKWDGKEWTTVLSLPAKISGWSFSENNELFVHSFKYYYSVGEENDNYLKKWDGKNSVEIALPFIYKKNRLDTFQKKNITYALLNDEKGGLYLRVWAGTNWTAFLYKFVNDNWVECGNNKGPEFFPTSRQIYFYRFTDREAALYKPKEYWEVKKREYSDVPIQAGVTLPAPYTNFLSAYRIQYDGNRRCFVEKSSYYGACLIDIFDSIAVVKTPLQCLLYFDPQDKQATYGHVEMKDYALQCISGQDTLYLNLTKDGIFYRQGFVKKYIPINYGVDCKNCDGAGFTGGGTITSSQKVGKDWVDGTRETRRVLTTNGYRYETVTNPGYYKSYEYKTNSKTVGSGRCSKCNGLGKIGSAPAKWVVVNYLRNNFNGRYFQLWPE